MVRELQVPGPMSVEIEHTLLTPSGLVVSFRANENAKRSGSAAAFVDFLLGWSQGAFVDAEN